jgi:Flp pilus assembly protein TadD
VENFQRALKLNRHDSTTWYNLGIAYHELGKDEELTEALRHACEESPSSAKYRETLVGIVSLLAYRNQIEGNHEKAMKLYKEALAVDDSRAQNWYNLALAHQQMGDLPSATDAAEKAAKLDPQNNVYRHLQDYLRKAVDHPEGNKNPTDP